MSGCSYRVTFRMSATDFVTTGAPVVVVAETVTAKDPGCAANRRRWGSDSDVGTSTARRGEHKRDRRRESVPAT